MRLALCTTLAVCLLGAIALRHEGAVADTDDHGPRPDVTVSVSGRMVGPPIAPGFVGVSIEYPALTDYTGTDPRRIDPVFETLLRNLAPGQSPVIRIGGNSTDTTWWPEPRRPRPAGVSFTLSPRWVAVVSRLAADLQARLILGIDLEARPAALGAREARALVRGLAPSSLLALELSNEASRYAQFPWYHDRAGRPVFARPRSYGFGSFAAEFAGLASLLPRSAPIAGPTLAGDGWMAHLPSFLRRQRRLDLVTFHRYPLNRCFTSRTSEHYPTIAHLLSPAASEGLARAVGRAVTAPRRRGLSVRLDEINSVACGGQAGVSNTAASALWALDTLFAMARAGVSGVNFHTFPRARYSLFHLRRSRGRWVGNVAPEYYGLATFAWAAPAGSRLLRTSRRGPASLRAWSTESLDGTIRVTLINDSRTHPRAVLIRTPTRLATASVLTLKTPGAGATGGLRLGGDAFDLSGSLARPAQTAASVRAPGRFFVSLAPASAAVVTIAH